MIRVGVGVIQRDDRRVLIQRKSLRYGHETAGKWEFAGGKLDENESAPDAIFRELKEELGIEVIIHEFLGEWNVTYTFGVVKLIVYLCRIIEGNPIMQDDQLGIAWVLPEELKLYDTLRCMEKMVETL